jgi:hypothetical protein
VLKFLLMQPEQALPVRSAQPGRFDPRVALHGVTRDHAGEIPPDLDRGLAATLSTRRDQTGAVRDFRASLRR